MDLKEMKEQAVKTLSAKKKLGKADVTKITVNTRHLKVPLSQKEIIEMADNLAQSLEDIDSLETELESIKSQFKSKLKELEGKSDGYRTKVRNKYEIRKVDCVEVLNNTAGTALEVRMDTGEIINERILTADERQGRLWETEEEEAA